MGVVLQFLLVAGPALTGQASPLTPPPTAADAAPPPVTVVRFDPPVEITIRTRQRNILRGLMLSFDAKAVQIQTRQGKVISYPSARIRTLRTRDGRFSWQPGSETFETARKNAGLFRRGIPMARRPKSTTSRPGVPLIPRPRRTGPLVPKPRSRPLAIPGAVRPGQPMTRTPETPTTDPGSTDESMETPEAQTIPDEQGKVCANCQRAVPDSLSTGNFCPYCGARWTEEGRHVPVVDGGDAHTASVRLPPGTPESGPMSWHQLGQKYWWVSLVLLVGWAVWLLRS